MSSDAITIEKSTVRNAGLAVAGVLSVALLVFAASILINQLRPGDPLAANINGKEFQAVFLTNGQAYFGRLTAPGGDFYELRQVYYLSAPATLPNGKPAQQHLIKLGSELHGPEDLMVINRAQILFVENLKPSGKVSRAIQAAGKP